MPAASTLETVGKEALDTLKRSLSPQTGVPRQEKDNLERILEELIKLNSKTTTEAVFEWIGKILSLLSLGAITCTILGVLVFVAVHWDLFFKLVHIFFYGKKSKHYKDVEMLVNDFTTRKWWKEKAANTAAHLPKKAADNAKNVLAAAKDADKAESSKNR